ncbi:tyrosine-type recombinase/integrase [Pelistega sp. MC2]|uniref:tyrosine-type recombinase/integrase n=1 Tax=Pelistega sp. MC2 TaxID=1720297 RepID=UPI0008D90426|nr:tyrosine-type recombinase/integrase [Pelistega sp. MC2]
MLTDKEIKTVIIPSNKSSKLTDGKGLYLLVTSRGNKYWRFDYKFNQKRKTLALGVYPEISLKQARELHRKAMLLLEQGTDPMVDKTQKQAIINQDKANTFEVVALKWWDYWHYGKAQHYTQTTLTGLYNVVFPEIGNIPIKELVYSDIRRLIESIVARGAFDIAKRTLQKINQIMRFAYAREYVTVPLPEIRPGDLIPSRKRVNFKRIHTHEIPQLLEDIDLYTGSPITVIAIKLMLLTFVRTSELINAQWSELDLLNHRWIIPAERMKMGKEHIVPLSKQALNLLRELHHYSSGTKWLFPSSSGRKGEKSISNNTILFALYRMGYRDKMTGHGFRGLASTALHEMDFPHQHIEAQLAHAEPNRVSAAYNHATYLKQRVEMMQVWADFLDNHAPKGFFDYNEPKGHRAGFKTSTYEVLSRRFGGEVPSRFGVKFLDD